MDNAKENDVKSETGPPKKKYIHSGAGETCW